MEQELHQDMTTFANRGRYYHTHYPENLPGKGRGHTLVNNGMGKIRCTFCKEEMPMTNAYLILNKGRGYHDDD